MRLTRLKNRLLARLFTAFPALAARWGARLEASDVTIPWTAPVRPLAQARLALVTTGGVHLRTQPPFDMSDPDGDPSCRAIPATAAPEELTITHDYYDHRDADGDLDLVLPVNRFRWLVEIGALGALHETCFSFMGHIDGPHVATLVSESAPAVAAELARDEVDYAFLVPA